MDHSQRCASGIYSFANDLIDFSLSVDDLKHSFFPIKMKPVIGRNPQRKDALSVSFFEDYKQEKNFILEKIRKIFASDKDASVAILVRNNYHIDDYSEFLSDYGYTVITKNDTLESQSVFSLIYAILKFCAHPWQNEHILHFYRVLVKQN